MTTRAASRSMRPPTCTPSATCRGSVARRCDANPGAEGWWLDEIGKGQGADVSVMLYTSGTTGRPKG